MVIPAYMIHNPVATPLSMTICSTAPAYARVVFANFPSLKSVTVLRYVATDWPELRPLLQALHNDGSLGTLKADLQNLTYLTVVVPNGTDHKSCVVVL